MSFAPPIVDFLPAWLARQRWYVGKPRLPLLVRVGGARWEEPARGPDSDVVIEIHVLQDSSGPQPVVYHVPLTYRSEPLPGGDPHLIAVAEHAELGRRWIYDGPHDAAYVAVMLRRTLPAPHRGLVPQLRAFTVFGGEQSNTSIFCDLDDAEPVVVKVLRVLAPGINPDIELPAALTRLGSVDVPEHRGHGRLTYSVGDDLVSAVAVSAQTRIPGVRDAWQEMLEMCRAGHDPSAAATALGETTARIHRDLAAAKGTWPATEAARTELVDSIRSRYAAALAAVPDLAGAQATLEAALADLLDASWPQLQRVHGDYHLGQVLAAGPAHFLVIDFEGEPLRPLAERSHPEPALRDVAGMVRSFDYVAGTVETELGTPGGRAPWTAAARAAFLGAYHRVAGSQPGDQALLRALELDKALYEVAYEAANRPDWLPIPLAAVHALTATPAAPDHTTLRDPSHRKTHMEPVQTSAQVADYSAVDAFLEGRHSQPHDLLGHHLGPGGLTITCYRPMAASVRAKLADGQVLDLPHVKGGIWSGTTDVVEATQDYRLLVDYGDGVEHEQDDPYRFAPSLGEMDRFLFNEGRHEQLWKVLGSHVHSYPGPLGDVWGVSFAVWAPNATAVHVVGDFNGWDRLSHPMRDLRPSGVWELFLPGAGEGMNYQYLVRGQDGSSRLKADPMAQFAEVAPKQASIVWKSHYEWGDQDWMAARADRDVHHGPMSVYEVHIGSWRQGEGYAGLAEHLVNYVRDAGFTHVEFLPVMEHPYVPSWGYHVTGYYAVSSRWGNPDEFRLLVDYLHRNGIGVLLDWVPGHFATDPWAMASFDGQPLYEHPDPRKGWHKEWGSLIFDFGRSEVRNFLVANATYWLEEFHIDGLRVDGVASMLYLDYARQPGEWIPNIHGGRENLDAVALLQEANATAYKRTPGVVMIAEESTSWAGVTHSTDADGLGFGFKWNMGWMNDALRYLAMDPIYRQFHHSKLTFALMYAFTEKFLLPISHDEVVHGKGSLMRKSRGSREEQIATLRAFLAYMWSHPGKQLLFMGCEFAQESEWSDGRSLDWWLMEQPLHYRVHNQVKEMNAIYRDNRALWALDHDPAGFRWLNADNATANTFSYLRLGEGNPAVDAAVVAVVVNFSGQTHEPYRIGLPRGGQWRVALDTAGFYPDAPSSAGLVLDADSEGWDGQPYAVNVTVPNLSAVWLTPQD
ncbi:MAG: 1,4-alpha-glucan branching protein GlgB [Actinomycetales bacterium]|nr:1,4-alpha-glucan branching protein GlgB [Actinomycetales bacterium]